MSGEVGGLLLLPLAIFALPVVGAATYARPIDIPFSFSESRGS